MYDSEVKYAKPRTDERGKPRPSMASFNMEELEDEKPQSIMRSTRMNRALWQQATHDIEATFPAN